MDKKDQISLTTLAKGSLINILGNGSGRVLLLVFTIIGGRFLGPSEMGKYFLGLNVYNLLSFTAVLGLNFGVVRYVSIAIDKKIEGDAKGTVITSLLIAVPISILIALLMYLCAPYLSDKLFNNTNIQDCIRILSYAIPLFVVCNIMNATTRAIRKMQYTVYTDQLLLNVFKIVTALSFLYLFAPDAKYFALSHTISVSIAALLSIYFVQKNVPFMTNPTPPRYKFRKMMSFSFPLVFSRIFSTGQEIAPTIFLAAIGTLEGVGVFNVANRIVAQSNIIQLSFRNILEPVIATFYARSDFKAIEKYFQSTIKWIFSVMFPFIVLLFIFSDFIISFFGKDFVFTGVVCLQILSVGYLIAAILSPSAAILAMTGHTKVLMYNNIIVLLLSLIMNWILIKQMGIYGAATATTLAMITLNFLRVFEVWFFFKIHPFRRDLYKPLMAGVLAFLPIVYLKASMTSSILQVTMILLYLVLYILFLFAFKLNDEDKFILEVVKKKIKNIA
ncbi:MAG: flippase [Desulfobacula sp.]|nr:flippase [Desulfobacula sp.]